MLNATLDWLIFNDRAKTKLVFLFCGEIVKNSTQQITFHENVQFDSFEF